MSAYRYARVEIQRISRGWLARRFVKTMETTAKNDAARRIQRITRGVQVSEGWIVNNFKKWIE